MKTLLSSITIAMLVLVASCTKSPVDSSNGESITTTDLGSGMVSIKASCERDAVSDVSDRDVTKLINGNLDFALILFRELAGESRNANKNIVISPYSLSTVFAMASAGARGETERQIQNALWFPFMGMKLHAAFNTLDQNLANAGNRFGEFKSINTMWCQKDYEFLPCFLRTLSQKYGTGVNLTDFASHPEDSRCAINTLISEQTNNRITGLFPEGSIGTLTRLVLTNAVYFYSEWEYCFGDFTCGDAVFNLLDGTQVSAPLMSMSTLEDTAIKINYTSGENYEAVELPYKDKQLSMVIILPSPGCYRQVESTLENNNFSQLLENFSPEDANVTIPKFSISKSVALKPVLDLLGMHAPFDETADFSGINGRTDLYISDVFHKTFIAVDEKGTEATAASGISFMEKGGPKDFCANRPFIFFIKDNKTNIILFIGRVLDPNC